MSIFLNLHKQLDSTVEEETFIIHFNLNLMHWLSLPNRKDDLVKKSTN